MLDTDYRRLSFLDRFLTGMFTRLVLVKLKGKTWYDTMFVHVFSPVPCRRR